MAYVVRLSGLVVFVSCCASSAFGQTESRISLVPPDARRWDVTGYVGWFGRNKSDIGFEWDDWYDAASFGVSTGYYWTPNLKSELDVSAGSRGHVYTQETIPVPGVVYPYPRLIDHYFESTRVTAGVSYQFLENSWFHPFLGLGVEVERERERVEARPLTITTSDPRAPIVLAAVGSTTEMRHVAHALASTGFKWYVSERAFIRNDLRLSFSRTGTAIVEWRGGVGLDF